MKQIAPNWKTAVYPRLYLSKYLDMYLSTHLKKSTSQPAYFEVKAQRNIKEQKLGLASLTDFTLAPGSQPGFTCYCLYAARVYEGGCH